MNNDLISRSALKKALHNFFDGKVIDEPAYILRDVFCYIDGAPTVKLFCSYLSDGEVRQPCVEGPCEQERAQGEWIHDGINIEGMDLYRCSICNRTIVTWSARIDEYPYCHCGASMKGGAE